MSKKKPRQKQGDLFEPPPQAARRTAVVDVAVDIATEMGIATAMQKLARDDGPAWLESALLAIQTVARQQAVLCVDDVWKLMGPQEGGQEYRSQMGIAFRLAKRYGWIKMAGVYRESKRAPRHRSPIRMWLSRVYVEQEVAAAAP